MVAAGSAGITAGHFVRVRVSDTGSGMTHNVLERLRPVLHDQTTESRGAVLRKPYRKGELARRVRALLDDERGQQV